MPKVIDSLTGVEFNSYQEYLDHTSPVTGFKPTDPEHFGKTGLLVAKEALARTGSLDTAAQSAIDTALDKVENSKVQEKLSENKLVLLGKINKDRPAARAASRERRIT